MRTLFAATCGLMLLAGCATTSKDFNRLSLGMSKPQVIDILGQPRSTGADAEAEYLHYSLHSGIGTFEEPYVVEIRDGKVVKYGHAPRSSSGSGCVTIPLNGMMVTRCNSP